MIEAEGDRHTGYGLTLALTTGYCYNEFSYEPPGRIAMYHSTVCPLFCALFLMAPMPTMFQDRTPETFEPEEETVAPRLLEGVPLHGLVLTPDGLPATDATLVLTTGKNMPLIQGDKIQHIPKGKEHYVVKTGEDGRFAFEYINFQQEQRILPPGVQMQVIEYLVIILHDSGTRCLLPEVIEAAIMNGKPIILERWGRVEGTVYTGTKPAKGVDLHFSPSYSGRGQMVPHVSWSFTAVSDTDGQFVFEKVPPGSGQVSRGIRTLDLLHEKRTHFTGYVPVNVCGGETVTLNQIGGDGRPVIGKLVWENTGKASVNKEYLVSLCTLAEPPDSEEYHKLFMKDVPESIRNETDPVKKYKMLEKWETVTEAGRTFAPKRQEHEAKQRIHNIQRQRNWKLSGIAPDGTFRIDDVPEGDWQLEVTPIDRMPVPNNDALLKHRVQIPAIPGGVSDDPLDVGTLTLVLE